MSFLKSSSAGILARAEYHHVFGQVFFSKCSFNFLMEISVFIIFASVEGSAWVAFRLFAGLVGFLCPLLGLASAFGGW